MNDNILNTFNPRSCIAGKIQKSNRIINNIFRKHLKPLGVSNSQVSILFVLSKKKTITQKELADFLYLEKSTVKRNIERLIQQEYFIINESNQVNISKKGLDYVKTIIPIWELAMQEAQEKLGELGLEALLSLEQTLTK